MAQINEIIAEVGISSSHMELGILSHYIDPRIIYSFIDRYGFSTPDTLLYRDVGQSFGNIWGFDFIDFIKKSPTFKNTIKSPYLFYNNFN